MTIQEAQALINKDIEKAKAEALSSVADTFPYDEWEKYVPEGLRDEAQDFTVQEKREILAAAKARVNPPKPKEPEIPKYIEVPRPKNWNQFGSIAVPGNGIPHTDGAVEMERRINPRWVETQKPASDPPPHPAGQTLTYGAPIIDPFQHVMGIGQAIGEYYTVKHFQQLTPDTITITFALKG